MTRRREVARRISTLGDIGEILRAMKNLALVEQRRIEGFIRAQREAVAVIEDVVADFLADRPGLAAVGEPPRDVLCLLGSERGFCGDFNARVIEQGRQWRQTHPAPLAVALVGDRLASDWTGGACTAIGGAGVADEVPAVLRTLAGRLPSLFSVAMQQQHTLGLVVIHHGPERLLERRLLPIPQPPRKAPRRAYPLTLNLPPARFFEQLTDQYLAAALQHALYESLLEENRLRMEHMEHAVHRLQDELDILGRRRNRLRQEEITEEIEVILLSAGIDVDAPASLRSDRARHHSPG